jgi:hypothetical protein
LKSIGSFSVRARARAQVRDAMQALFHLCDKMRTRSTSRTIENAYEARIGA